ncbi:MAG: glutamate formimidoyltransferase [Firmicutes bacterium]|nr:glutamate formimidoyltransferase [Bacillota bacterium]
MPAPGDAYRRPLVAFVPNFSEGRREEVMEELVAACLVPGVQLLDRHADADHNRLVLTLVGEPEAVRRSALEGARAAMRLIDMESHRGSHPRIGALDVAPFVPVRGLPLEECVRLARDVGRALGEMGLPVYLYDRAAIRPEYRELSEVRRGQYEGLRQEVAEGRRLPDFGPHEIGRAGATAVGARGPIVAFNAFLRGGDERLARRLARRIRASSGGLQNVRAIGFALPEGGLVEVSMDLTDPEATPLYRAFELLGLEARRYGLDIASSEIVGLVPASVLEESASYYLRLEGFDPGRQVLERAVARADEEEAQRRAREHEEAERRGAVAARRVGDFLEALASDAPAPGGGAAAGLSGALGAALVGMVAALTRGRRRYAELEPRMAAVEREAEAARQAFLSLADRDAHAFDAVIAARRLPRESEAEREAREEAIQEALREACQVPLEVARRAVEVMELAREVTETGNVQAISDGASAGALLWAACQAALLNVEINLAGLRDGPELVELRAEVEALRKRSDELWQAARIAFRHRR